MSLSRSCRVALEPGQGRAVVDAAARALGWRLLNIHRAPGGESEIYFGVEGGEAIVVFEQAPGEGPHRLLVHGHDPEGEAARARDALARTSA